MYLEYALPFVLNSELIGLIVALAIAVIPEEGGAITISGGLVYPDPGFVMLMAVTTPETTEAVDVAVTMLFTFLSLGAGRIVTVGADAYPEPPDDRTIVATGLLDAVEFNTSSSLAWSFIELA
jgi:hypothetical protein